MKTIKNIIAASIAVTILFSSCAVEKRRYRKGYNVESKSKKPKEEPAKVETTTSSNDNIQSTTTVQPALAVYTGTVDTLTNSNQPAVTPAATTGVNTSYTFSVKVGPRPDKKKVQAKHKPHK